MSSIEQPPVAPVDLSKEKWPIAVHIQLAPNLPVATMIVPCGDEREAFKRAWHEYMAGVTTVRRLDALEAVDWKKNTDQANGFGVDPAT